MLRLLEGSLRESILSNENFQIQVCSQGRLTPKRAAYLGIAFYLGSDRIRTPNKQALKTSHSETGKRLIIYGAGECARHFKWFSRDDPGNRYGNVPPSGIKCRTDVLWCHSERDIYNVNLLATLLVHDQYNGYWQALGEEFQCSLREILIQHELAGILDAPWIRLGGYDNIEQEDETFASAFQELSTYALTEAKRLSQSTPIQRSGILAEVQDLLQYYHQKVHVGPQW